MHCLPNTMFGKAITTTNIPARIFGYLWPDKTQSDSNLQGQVARLALMTAMLSVFFEKAANLFKYSGNLQTMPTILVVGMFVSLLFVLTEKYWRIAVLLFCLFLLPAVVENWATYANHGWLAVWTIPAALLFTKFWREPHYANYLRYTLGIIMLAACAQKILAGTYLDGSYIAYLSYFGGTTENMFRFLCSEQTLQTPCGWHRFLGTFIVLWQFGVGILLLAGVRSFTFLMIEIGFLLGAGLYADEMNFQVLNISLLCLAFGVGMSYRLFFVCVALLLIDLHGIGEFIGYVL